MLLFQDSHQPVSIISKDGSVVYIRNFLSPSLSNTFLQKLLEFIPWQSDRIFLYGKEILTKRKFCWMGDAPFSYNYSKNERIAIPWEASVKEIKEILENKIPHTFNSCLLNRYQNGSEAMGWHADNESCMKKRGAIASISLGESRTMEFRHKVSKEKVKVILESGSLLLMLNETQEFWQHQLIKSVRVKQQRVNLTFRTFVENP